MLAKSLITIFVLSNAFGWIVPVSGKIADFFVRENLTESIQDIKASILAISADQTANPNFLPIRDWNVNEPESQARASLIFDTERDKILYQENPDQQLPIASLSKIMTAIVVLDNIDDLEKTAVISEKAIAGYGDRGGLNLDEEISIKNLLFALLMESSNDAAFALAEKVENETGRNFVRLMNEKSRLMGLKKTFFVDPSGYNPANMSTAREIKDLVVFSLKYHLIWEIMKTPVIDLYSADNQIHHYWVNTDKLLNRLEDVIGGKTGYTDEAKGCLILALNEPSLISVVLGADERFLETEKLIDWVKQAYKW